VSRACVDPGDGHDFFLPQFPDRSPREKAAETFSIC